MFDELVQVGREALEHNAQVLVVDKLVSHPEDMVLVLGISFAV